MLNNLLNEYLEYIKSVRRFSDNTVKSYKNDLEQFIDILSQINKLNLEDVSDKIVRRFMMFLSQNGYQAKSIARKLTSVKNFYKYAFEKGKIPTNTITALRGPRVKRALPEIITQSQFDSAFESIEKENSENSIMDLAIIELLYGCSLRVSEVCNCKRIDVDLSIKQLRIIGKGNKERIVPIGSTSSKTLSRYIESQPHFSNGFLFTTSTGKKLYSKYVYNLVNKHLSIVSEVKKKSPHILRHSSATHMLDAGADLLAIKEILGHSSLSTTQIYAQVSIERLKNVYKQSHPKS